MYRIIGLLIFVAIFGFSCPDKGPTGPIVPTSHPGGDHEPHAFCIDFEHTSNPDAINRANAALLYQDLGITMSSNPAITNNSALCQGFQCLIQGDTTAARPEASCEPLEIQIDPGLNVGRVEFQARNVGFISTPTLIYAKAFGRQGIDLVELDEFSEVSRSRLGDLEPVENVILESLDRSDPPITSLFVQYWTCPRDPDDPEVTLEPCTGTTCPPQVVIDELCFSPRERTIGTVGQTDAGADRLVYYFDNRDRESSFQLANLSNREVDVHVQIFLWSPVIAACEEINFLDSYTAKDVHTYETLNLVTNTGNTLDGISNTLAGKHGFIVVSKSGEDAPRKPLVGSMSIHDFAGYEYKTNAVAPEASPTARFKHGIVNFNNINGIQHSELVGFGYTVVSPDTVAAAGVSAQIGSIRDHQFIVNEHEEQTMCRPNVFSCDFGVYNIGIDHSLPNPKNPENFACTTSILNESNNAGWLYLPVSRVSCTDPSIGDEDENCLNEAHFVGFIGLTDGDNIGVFDSWWGGETTDDE